MDVEIKKHREKRVALLAEGVDRNSYPTEALCAAVVALLAEGVDRNIDINREITAAARSPSSRRAWIEIQCHPYRRHSTPVALLAEGVDRNTEALKDKLDGIGRPPRGGRG